MPKHTETVGVANRLTMHLTTLALAFSSVISFTTSQDLSLGAVNKAFTAAKVWAPQLHLGILKLKVWARFLPMLT